MFSQRLQTLAPYVPGEQPRDRRYIKLNTNENPYPPSPRIAEYLSAADLDSLRRYPDPCFTELRQAVARRYGVAPEQVFAGNGSDEVLSFAFFAFFDSFRGPLLFPRHTYSFYPVYCDYYGIEFSRILMTADFGVDLSAFAAALPACGAIFPNPNAPTGIALPLSTVADFLSAFPADRVVVVDEAYVDFGGESAICLIDTHPNLLIVRTASKSMSLAGVRLGFAMGHPALIRALFAAKDAFNSYPVSALAQRIGVLALGDGDYYDGITRRIVRTRERLAASLLERSWRVLPSSANFIFAEKPGLSGAVVYETLKSRGILVRHFDADGLRDFVRITVGTEEETAQLVSAIDRGFEGIDSHSSPTDPNDGPVRCIPNGDRHPFI